MDTLGSQSQQQAEDGSVTLSDTRASNAEGVLWRSSQSNISSQEQKRRDLEEMKKRESSMTVQFTGVITIDFPMGPIRYPLASVFDNLASVYNEDKQDALPRLQSVPGSVGDILSIRPSYSWEIGPVRAGPRTSDREFSAFLFTALHGS